jgi:GMP synthase-like glutamine amidotransferase
MLGCEDHPPYGPTEATGALFLTLIASAIQSAYPLTCSKINTAETVDIEIVISIFRVQVMDYPTDKEWGGFDGVLIPGSFSSAYETAEWIEQLKRIIQEEIYAKQRKTMAVCFGHQLYAHSFNPGGQGGLCQPCPRGHQAGRRISSLTKEGLALLRVSESGAAQRSNDVNVSETNSKEIHLMYTHGDMVTSLPPCAVPLFGNDAVQIQAAAYFVDAEAALKFRQKIDAGGGDIMLEKLPRPHAFTFQAHPEYSSKDGLSITFTNILTALGERNALPQSHLTEAKVDTTNAFPELQKESIDLMVTVGKTLRWF